MRKMGQDKAMGAKCTIMQLLGGTLSNSPHCNRQLF